MHISWKRIVLISKYAYNTFSFERLAPWATPSIVPACQFFIHVFHQLNKCLILVEPHAVSLRCCNVSIGINFKLVSLFGLPCIASVNCKHDSRCYKHCLPPIKCFDTTKPKIWPLMSISGYGNKLSFFFFWFTLTIGCIKMGVGFLI